MMTSDEEEDVSRIVPFQLQFDKPLASQKIKIAEWNPEKDLLAMVTHDSKILLHRFNWQRLWTISPGRCITSLCWRPDGKAIAVGLQDGTISLHDVENGKLLRSIKSHTVAVVCLNWEDDADDNNLRISKYEDRTSRFFPPPPRVPRVPGLVTGETGFMDESDNISQELSNSSHQRFNILCSADKNGIISFSIFGIFPIAKIDIHDFSVSCLLANKQVDCKLLNASICKVALSKDLCHLTVLCSGDLQVPDHDLHGFHCLTLDTSIFYNRVVKMKVDLRGTQAG
ncbi:anaphase-promoting complex subunit 4 [Tanacetum coccineum]